MQLTIDLTNQPAEYGKRVIAMIEAFYGITADPHAEDDAYRRGMQAARSAAATVPSIQEQEEARQMKIDHMAAAQAPSVLNPLPHPTPVTSTVVAAPSSTAPVEPQASSPAPSVPPVPAVPTVPAATAPTAPAAPTSPAGIELDTDGLPWDARIHSSSKAKNADGRWRAKKGLNDGTLVARIQAELRAAMAVPASGGFSKAEVAAAFDVPLVVLAAPATTGIVGNNPATVIVDEVYVPAVPVDDGTPITSVLMADGVTAVPLAPEVPAAATPFVPPPPPVTPIQTSAAPVVPAAPATVSGAQPNPTTLPELMPLVTSAMIAGKVKPTALLESLPEGIANLPTLAQRPDLIPQVWEKLKAANPGVWS